MSAPNPPMTHAEAVRNLDYVIRLNQRHERLYARIHDSIRFAELLAAGLALGVAFNATSASLAIAGGLLALVGMLSYAINPAQRLNDFTRARQQYTAIRTRSADLTFEQVESQRLAVEDPIYIEGLRTPSQNDMLRSHGINIENETLTPWQRVMHAIA